jgi:hypothetical protein
MARRDDSAALSSQSVRCTARGGLAADRRAPLVNIFPFFRNTRNWPSAQKKMATRRGKNLRKFLKVGNQIWNTFHH